MKEEDLVNMELHESFDLYMNHSLKVTRVPGGWVYTRYTKSIGDLRVATMCFVPLPPPVDVKG